MESIHIYVYMCHMIYEYAQNNVMHVLIQLDPCACQCAQVSPSISFFVPSHWRFPPSFTCQVTCQRSWSFGWSAHWAMWHVSLKPTETRPKPQSRDWFQFMSFFVHRLYLDAPCALRHQLSVPSMFPMPSFQDVLRPLQHLWHFKAQLQLCQYMIDQMELAAADLLSDVTAEIQHTKQALNQLQSHLEILSYRLMQILLLQSHHAYQSVGRLPSLETDWQPSSSLTRPCGRETWDDAFSHVSKRTERRSSSCACLLFWIHHNPWNKVGGNSRPQNTPSFGKTCILNAAISHTVLSSACQVNYKCWQCNHRIICVGSAAVVKVIT